MKKKFKQQLDEAFAIDLKNSKKILQEEYKGFQKDRDTLLRKVQKLKESPNISKIYLKKLNELEKELL